LVQSEATSKRKSRARELLDWAREEEEDDGLKALVAPSDPDVSSVDEKKKSRMQREMEELQRWLEEEDQGDHQMAWVPSEDDSSTALPTPTIHSAHASFGDIGFDDDFSDFVGAPLNVVYGHESGKYAETSDKQSARARSGPYRALASVDDFQGEGSMFVHRDSGVFEQLQDSDDDHELPSQAEIEETSKKIFGSQLAVPSASTTRAKTPSPRSAFVNLHPPRSQSSLMLDSPSSSFARESDDEDDLELGAFDLSRVLGALQGMKEEIAGMTDEDERRKAAARVALGLVYGLQKENEREAA